MRSVGSASPTHEAGLVALAPGGRASDESSPAPPTCCEALPSTIFAPPERVQLAEPA
jgi:hypothetical protein